MGLQIRILEARNTGEIDVAFASFANQRPDALLSAAAPFLPRVGFSWCFSQRATAFLQPILTPKPYKPAG
jgi:hypothetical protein